MSGMRKKRKLRGRAEREAAALADLDTPEVQEALEAEALAAEFEAVEAQENAEEEAHAIPYAHLKSIIESLLFASDKALPVHRLRQLTGERKADGRVEKILEDLKEDYGARGFCLHHVGGGYQMRTHPANAEWVQKLVAGRPVRLSRPQLECLAIIAYRQPITRPEIDEIRGVDTGGTLKLLLERNLIRVLGKKEEPGRPLLYGTTNDFLEFFNLTHLRELPTLREYMELSDDSMAAVEKLGHDVSDDDVRSVVAEAEAAALAAAEAEALAKVEAEARAADEAEESDDVAAPSEAEHSETMTAAKVAANDEPGEPSVVPA